MGFVFPYRTNTSGHSDSMGSFSDHLLRYRTPLTAALYTAIFIVSYWLAFQLRFDFVVYESYQRVMWESLAIFVVAKLLSFWALGELSGWWRYVSLNDMLGVSRATALGSLLSLLGVVGFGYFNATPSFPRSIFLVDPILTIALIGGVRVSIRLVRTWLEQKGHPLEFNATNRALIVGTGPTAESLAREVSRTPELSTKIVAFISPDPRFKGTRIQGIPILGGIEDIPRVADKCSASVVVVANEELSPEDMRKVVRICTANDLKHRILPSADALLQGQISFSSLREVDLRDLLGRAPVRLSNAEIAHKLNNQVVLVTGAGGSIGSELCRQVARFGPSELILLEQAENPLFHLERELLEDFTSVTFRPIVADVYDSERIHQLMQVFKPAFVLHAAAHKHVPLMEANPSEAIKNNIIGTLNVIRAAQKAEVETCVLISTDKAVNPTSVMGASKRVAEMLMQALAVKSETRLAAVRFGNVLGSNGSVIPIFKKQIENGGPVTVTHPEMRRFFMTIPEATQLVLQAATYAHAGDIFVLDMGEPVYIIDVARDLIRLSGLEPNIDIPIVISGMRPGEKLFEELATDAEQTSATAHERIFRCEVQPPDSSKVIEAALALEKNARAGAAPKTVRAALFHLLTTLDHPSATAAARELESKIVPSSLH